MPDSVDWPALGCYPWAEASATAYAVELSSAGSLGFCTNNSAAAPSGALPTSSIMSGTFASNVAASSSTVVTCSSLVSVRLPLQVLGPRVQMALPKAQSVRQLSNQHNAPQSSSQTIHTERSRRRQFSIQQGPRHQIQPVYMKLNEIDFEALLKALGIRVHGHQPCGVLLSKLSHQRIGRY